MPAQDIADVIFSLVIEVELRNRIDGDTARADRLFRLGSLVANPVQSTTPDRPDPQVADES